MGAVLRTGDRTVKHKVAKTSLLHYHQLSQVASGNGIKTNMGMVSNIGDILRPKP